MGQTDASHHVRAGRVDFADDVKEKGLDVVVERLVVKEELGEQAEVLTVDALVLGVDLEDGDRAVPVDLVAGRVEGLAFGLQVAVELLGPPKKGKVKLAKVEDVGKVELLRDWRKVPRLDEPLAKDDPRDVFHLRATARRRAVKEEQEEHDAATTTTTRARAAPWWPPRAP